MSDSTPPGPHYTTEHDPENIPYPDPNNRRITWPNIFEYHNHLLDIAHFTDFGTLNKHERSFIARHDDYWNTKLYQTPQGKGRHAKAIRAMTKWRMNNMDKAKFYKKKG